MKRIYSILLMASLLLAFIASCDPIENRDGVGTVLKSADEIQATVTPVMDNGKKTNKVRVHCTSPVVCQWTDSVRIYASNDTAMTLFTVGSQTVTLNALAADGTLLTKNYNVTVDEMKFPVDPQYGYFCGTGKKVWTWAATKCFGNGGSTDTAPAWWILAPSDIASQCSGKGLPADGEGATMTFILKGLKMTKTSTDGANKSGTFLFDMSDKKDGWSIGKLKFTNTNILCGYDFNATGYTAWSEYNIIYLDDNKMILGAQEHSPNSNYWYWVFVPKP